MAEINNEKAIKIPKKDERLAELVGIILGDGGIYKNKKLSMYELRIAGNSQTDKEYLLEYVKPLIEKLFGIKVRIYFSKKRNCLHIIAQGVRLINYLESIGLKSGDKVKNNINIPKWIFDSDIFVKSCLRGLIDTDGCVLPITGRDYTYIWFSSGIPNLRKDFEKIISKLDYKISKWNFNRTPETYIGSKKMIIKYYKEIGFSNPKHIKRFKMPELLMLQ